MDMAMNAKPRLVGSEATGAAGAGRGRFCPGRCPGAGAEPPKTIKPGKLTVGINGDMPMTSLKDGKLIGTDGELIATIAEQARPRGRTRADGMVGADPGHQAGPGRPDARQHGLDQGAVAGLHLTDPIYYFGTFFLQKKKTNFTTFDDMKGHSIGTVTASRRFPR